MIEVQVRERCPEEPPPSGGGLCRLCANCGYIYRWVTLQEAVRLAHSEEARSIGKALKK
jgi:hypothetical protein